jgi:hypothetical protein
MWDIFVVFLLLVVCILVPWRICFEPEDSAEMWWAFTIVDVIFFVDMIICFFTSITDPYSFEEITNKKIIAQTYLRLWFWVDLVSILPFYSLAKLAFPPEINHDGTEN